MVANLITVRPGRTCGARASHAVPGQGLRSGAGSILDCASVVVLVASKCRASRECLLTIGIRTLVRSLTRVNPTMTCQRARVAEGLFCFWSAAEACLPQCRRTHLAATFTHVWLLSSVHSLMDGKSGTLDELFAAVWVVADMRPHSSVDALCSQMLARRLGFK